MCRVKPNAIWLQATAWAIGLLGAQHTTLDCYSNGSSLGLRAPKSMRMPWWLDAVCSGCARHFDRAWLGEGGHRCRILHPLPPLGCAQ